MEFYGILLWFRYWEGFPKYACTKDENIFPITCIFLPDLRSVFFTVNPWNLMKRNWVKYISLIRSSCKVVKCYYLKRVDNHKPLRTKLLHMTTDLLISRYISCSLSFQELHNRETHMLFSAFRLFYMCCLGRNQQLSKNSSSQLTNSKVSSLDGQYLAGASMKHHLSFVWNIYRPNLLKFLSYWQCNQKVHLARCTP